MAEELENRFSVGDIARITFDDGYTELCVITMVEGTELDVVCLGGRTTYRNVKDGGITLTGAKFNFTEFGKWVDGTFYDDEEE